MATTVSASVQTTDVTNALERPTAKAAEISLPPALPRGPLSNEETQKFISALTSPESGVPERSEAANLLSRFGGPEAIGPLVSAMLDPNTHPNAQFRAMKAAGGLAGTLDHNDPRLLAGLLQVASDTSSFMREDAITWLSNYNDDPRTRECLFRVANNPKEEPRLRLLAGFAGRSASMEGLRELALGAQYHENHRLSAIRVMAEMPRIFSATLSAIATGHSNPSQYLREEALSALSRSDPENARSVAIQVLSGLKAPSLLGSQAALQVKGTVEPKAESALAAIWGDIRTPLEVRKQLIGGIDKLNTPEAIERLMNVAKDPAESAELRSATLTPLVKNAPARAIPLALNAAKDSNLSVGARFKAISALKVCTDQRRVSALLSILGDERADPMLREECAEALTKSAGPESLAEMRKLALDENQSEGIRKAAIKCLSISDDERPLKDTLTVSALSTKRGTSPEPSSPAGKEAITPPVGNPKSSTELSGIACDRYLDTASRLEAIKQLSLRQDKQATDTLFRLATSDHNILPLAAAEGLAAMKDPRGEEMLLRFTLDRDQKLGAVKALLRTDTPSAIGKVFSIMAGGSETAQHEVRLCVSQHMKGDFADRLKVGAQAQANSPLRKEMLAYATALDEARTLGIEHPLRWSPDVLAAVVDERHAEKQATVKIEKPLAVVIAPAEDENNAFFGENRLVKDLLAAGYRVSLHEAKTRSGMIGSVLDATKSAKAQVILFAGHGQPDSMKFGPQDPNAPGECRMTLADERFLTALSDRLLAGGQIVLYSCANGAGREKLDNMANMMRRVFPHAAPAGIFSTVEPANSKGLEFEGNKIKRVRFMGETYQASLDRPEYRTQA